jgi:ribosomal protein L34
MERLTKNKKQKMKRKYGFLERMSSHGGQKVLKRRRNKQRTRLAA